jgi:hypothetical protein
MKQRRVVCAAIRADDGTLILGIRHYSADMITQIHHLGEVGTKFHHRHGKDQGFVDQHGVYMDRHEAYNVALSAGQVVYPDACTHEPNGSKLYSEGLY